MQGLLCGTLQNIIHKIGPDKTKRISDNLMQVVVVGVCVRVYVHTVAGEGVVGWL